jgi:hypothetical protein
MSRKKLAPDLIRGESRFPTTTKGQAICDSIADGTLQILKIRESEMFQILVENIGSLRAD